MTSETWEDEPLLTHLSWRGKGGSIAIFPLSHGRDPARHPQQLLTQPTEEGSLLSWSLALLQRASGHSFKSSVHQHGMQQLFCTYGDPSSAE